MAINFRMAQTIPFRDGAGTITVNNGRGAVTYFGQPIGHIARHTEPNGRRSRWRDTATERIFPTAQAAAEAMLERVNPIRPGEVVTWAARPEVTGPVDSVEWIDGGYVAQIRHGGYRVAVPLPSIVRAEQVTA